MEATFNLKKYFLCLFHVQNRLFLTVWYIFNLSHAENLKVNIPKLRNI